MSGGAKVVPLKPENNDAVRRAKFARLPVPVHSLQEKGKQMLLGMLNKLFDNADDALFDLADKAISNREQNLYFDSMREVRIRRRTIESQFAETIDKAFANLANPAGTDVDPISDGDFSLDNLALVQNDELEQLVAADSMVSKAAEENAEAIQQLTLRIDSLVPLKVYHKNNPLGPEVIGHAFVNTAKSLNIDIKAKLVLFKLFDKFVISELKAFYQAVNNLLIEHNILPSLLSRSGSPRQTQNRRQPRREPVAGQASSPVGSAPASVAENELLQTLRGLLAGQRVDRITSTRASDVALDASDLVSLLTRIQAQQLSTPVADTDHVLLPQKEISYLLGQLIQHGGKAQQIGEVDEDVINLVNMMFEFILDDRNLAEPMKAMIARLQIPIVKVAIADKAFFSKGGHPARRLLNELATAALGWQDDGRRQDPLYKKIVSVVQRVLNEFESDVDIFHELLTDFISFVEKEKHRASILEQRTLDAEDGKAKTEAARREVAQAIEERLPVQALPEVVEKLLHEAWSNVLFLICLKQGGNSEEWRQGLRTVEDLIWSVCAQRNPENRQRMLKLVPGLLKRLRSGLESVSYNPFEMTQLFKQLEQLHLEQLRVGLSPSRSSEPSTIESDVDLDVDMEEGSGGQPPPNRKSAVQEAAAKHLKAVADVMSRSYKTGTSGDIKASQDRSSVRGSNDSLKDGNESGKHKKNTSLTKGENSPSCDERLQRLSESVQRLERLNESHQRSVESHQRSVESHQRVQESHQRVQESHKRVQENHQRGVESRQSPTESFQKPDKGKNTSPQRSNAVFPQYTDTQNPGQNGERLQKTEKPAASAALVSGSPPVEEECLAEGDEYLLLVDRLTQGAWFEMVDAGQRKFRCRLAAIIKLSGKYIFVNRSGVKVAEKDRNSLAVALKRGTLKRLDDGMLFDRALEAVIGSLRNPRSN